jgi:predicted nucleotidyltransferase
MKKPPAEFMPTNFAARSNPLDPAKAETLQRLCAVMDGRPMVLLGAFARDLIFYHFHGIASFQATKDIDISVGVASWPEYQHVCDALKKLDFRNADPAHPEKFTDLNGQEVDLLPFGSLSENGVTIHWPVDGSLWTISGIQEACADAWCFHFGAHELRVAPPCALIYLKLFAAHDRPEARQKKDTLDIYFLLTHYLTAAGAGRLLTGASDDDVMAKTDGNLAHAAARLAGRDMGHVLSAASADALRPILRMETEGQSRCPVAHSMARYFGGEFQKARALLRALRDGFEETSKRGNL